MSMVSEDLLDLDWKDYEGVIGQDPMSVSYTHLTLPTSLRV